MAPGTSASVDRPGGPSTTAAPEGSSTAEQIPVEQAPVSVLERVRTGLDALSTAPLDDHPAGFAALHAQLTDALAAVADS